MPIICDKFVKPGDPDDLHDEAHAAHVARLRDLLTSLERGERPAFALVYQSQGNAPKTSWSVTADSHVEGFGALGTLTLCLDQIRTDVAEAARQHRLAWRQAEEDANRLAWRQAEEDSAMVSR